MGKQIKIEIDTEELNEVLEKANKLLTLLVEVELKTVKTCDLVTELEKREGVEKFWAEPHQTEDISVEGPAVILVVTD